MQIDSNRADWVPDAATVAAANLTRFLASKGFADYSELHAWSASHPAEFWAEVNQWLGIVWDVPPRSTLEPTANRLAPQWFPGGRLNIVNSCFRLSPDATAVVYSDFDGSLQRVSRAELLDQVRRFAGGFATHFGPGARVAICMPMTFEAVVAYLGIIYAGGVAVSIADSFAPPEIATRMEIAGATGIVTQGSVWRAGRELEMFAKVATATGASAVVVDPGAVQLRDQDIAWHEFLGAAAESAASMASEDYCNILFSSGTTGDPKAIPWTHLTPIKAAMDGHFHHDIKPGDVVAWPTNLGWMMGPWLIFAGLINGAAIALYHDAPVGEGFGRFVQDAGVTMLGVVPSMVRAWRESGSMESLDWSGIRVFSSTGEASSEDDMRYLMDLAGGKPVIEYCGGTEIGGGYITGTVLQPAHAATFSTPSLGQDFVILDDEARPAGEGELFLRRPSIGLSRTLLNQDHTEVYFAGTPAGPDGEPLRRHGDHMADLGGGYFRAMGRVDDTMNLGGIKVSSAEIERALAGIEGVTETAAVAVPPPGGGPDRLVVFAVTDGRQDPDSLRAEMTSRLKSGLNPLFKVAEVELVDGLPRTASNKVMRRKLRAQKVG